MKKSGIVISTTLATILLAACGGGGGGSGGFPAITPPPAGAITITTANAVQVSAEVIGSIDTLEGGSSGVGLLTGVAVNQNGNGFRFSDFVVSQLGRFDVIKQQQLSSGIVGVVFGPVDEPCDSGFVTISGDADPSGNTLSTGDTLSLVFNNCSLFGTLFHGGLDLVINTVNPDPYDGVTLPYDLDISVVLTNLYVVEGGTTLGSDGDMRLELSDDGVGNHHEVLSGNSLIANLDGVAESLENYNYDLSYNDFTGDYTIVIAGTINTATLGGSVTFSTLTPFTGDDFFATGDHPTVGVLDMLSVSDLSSAVLTALSDGINLLIDVFDSNGSLAGTVPTTWAILESL